MRKLRKEEQDVRCHQKCRKAPTHEKYIDVRIESQRLTLRKGKFDLNDLLFNIVQDYCQQGKNSTSSGEGVAILYEPPDENIVVDADKERISQVMRNIIGNALEFTNEGNVSVTLRRERQHEKEGKQIAVVTVRDTGCG
jgi:two-component system phosphate regulon sensor histidine kinase PhoR